MPEKAPAYAFAAARFARAREALANRLSTPGRQLAEAFRVLAPLDSRDLPADVYTMYARSATLIGADQPEDNEDIDDLELAITRMDPGRVQQAIKLLFSAASALDRCATASKR